MGRVLRRAGLGTVGKTEWFGHNLFKASYTPRLPSFTFSGLDPQCTEPMSSPLGGKKEIEKLLQDEDLVSTEEAKGGLHDLELLFQYCDNLGIAEKVEFDMDLTRSLGYYTGLVFEAVLKVPRLNMEKNYKMRGILANGGRFDNLITKLTRNKITLPCVGFTFECEQLFTLLEFKEENTEIPTKETEVLITCNSPHMSRELLKLCKEFWDAGVKAEIFHPYYEKITDADKRDIPFIVCFTKEEAGRVVIETTSLEEKESVKRSEVVSHIKQQLLNLKETKPGAAIYGKSRKR
ncbi:Histidine--tRNA ligase, cytoplasmic [Holothuria leucospilota]|uniref:histidine--tRNA ligase n=1 Tax=Holothuria leucospilota TaxID=206669 RepID=A0A9Q1CUA4_HOLLE|nr:Histidine--tRNA ligase, cytoplasmic [Holothuria leucospilota]